MDKSRLEQEDWVLKKLENTATLKARIGWQGLTTKEYLDSGDYYLVTGTDFKDGLIEWKSCSYVDEKRYQQDKNIQLKINDVLVTKDGTIGKVAFINKLPKLATLNSGVFVIRPINESFYPKFFYYILSSQRFITFLNHLSAGSTINHLYQRDFIKFEYKTPPNIDDQKRIADVLADIDELIRSIDKLLEKKQQIKQGVMQELLTGKRRLPGFSDKWKYTSLDWYATKDKNSIVDGPFGSQMKVSDFQREGVPVIEMEDLNDSVINPSIERKISEEKFIQLKRSSVYPNDIIISKTGSLGYLGIIPNSINKAIITSRLAKISLDINKANISFIFQYLLKHRNDKYWESVSQGGTMQILSISMLKNAPIPNLSLTEQCAIAEILDDIDQEIIHTKMLLNKYELIKINMMQELLSGRIRLV